MNDTILIIEDSIDIARILQMILEDEGYRVIVQYDGSTIHRILQESATSAPMLPNLILMDVRIGKERGDTLCLALKQKKETRHIPIVLLSGLSTIQEIMQQCHADGYIEKPFDIDALVALLSLLLRATPDTENTAENS